MFLDELVQRMMVREIELEIDEAVVEKLAHDGFDPVYGARPLRREIERQVENPLAMKLVSGDRAAGAHVKVTVRDAQIRLQ
jgi:ATP-dependent Clp protease ATP-binding subunit ClpC